MNPRSYRMSLLDGSLYNFMVGAGETYLPAFVLAFGFGQISAGMIVVIPMVVGSLIQFILMRFLPLFESRQSMVVWLARVQGAALVVISAMAFVGHYRLRYLFVVACLYWAAGLTAGPLWNAWMGSIVPREESVQYFSKRSRICQFFLMLGLVGAGLWLHSFDDNRQLRAAFGWVFLLAGLSRIISAEALARHDKDTGEIPLYPLKVGQAFRWFTRPENFTLIVFLFFVQLTVHTAAPFFSPYMLKILQLDYASYMFLLAIALGARTGVYYVFPWLSKKLPVVTSSVFGFAGVIAIPFCWTLSDSYLWIMLLQVGSGVFWGLFELGNFLMVFNTRSHLDRSRVLTTVNFFNAIGLMAGAWVGAELLRYYGENQFAYTKVFEFSTWLRFVPLFFALPLIRKTVPFRRLFVRAVGSRVQSGLNSRPILYVDDHEEDGKN